jgi:DNA-binding LacI/PurR family transcriptional regulator
MESRERVTGSSPTRGAGVQRPTLEDVAAQAGVSRRVVSAILNPGSAANVGYSRETHVRVLEAIEAVGYRPNRTAESLRMGRHRAIGLLVHSLYRMPREPFLPELLAEADARDLQLTIGSFGENGELPVLLAQDSVDALVLFEHLAPAMERTVRPIPVPVVEVNTSNRTGPGCITFDDAAAVGRIVERFAGRGWGRPAFLDVEEDAHYSHEERWRALGVAAGRRGMAEPVRWVLKDPWQAIRDNEGAVVKEILGLLAGAPDVDCVILHSDGLAPTLYRALARRGRRVGKDVAVIGFNDSALARAVDPRLTSLRVDAGELARTVLDTAEDLVAGQPAPAARTLRWQVSERESG